MAVDSSSTLVPLGAGFVASPTAVGVPIDSDADLDPSTSEALQLADRFVRGRRILGRISRSPALLGVSRRPAANWTRCHVMFICDATSEDWWRDRVAGLGRQGRERLEEDPAGPPIHPDDPEGPGTFYEASSVRLVSVASQTGRLSHALIAPRTKRGTDVSYGFAVVNVPPSVDAADLTVFAIDEAPRTPLVRELEITRRSAVGLALEGIAFQVGAGHPETWLDDVDGPSISATSPGMVALDAWATEQAGFVSTGSAGARAGTGPRRLHTSCLVVNAEYRQVHGLVLKAATDDGVYGSDPQHIEYLATSARLQGLPPALGAPAHESPPAVYFRTESDLVVVEVDNESGPLLVSLPTVDPRGVEIRWWLHGSLVT